MPLNNLPKSVWKDIWYIFLDSQAMDPQSSDAKQCMEF